MKLRNSLFTFCLLILFSGCTFYSFVDGSSKYSENKKILITQYENNTGNGPPDIATIFTEKTKDFYLQNGDFGIVTLNEDLKLECEIIKYDIDNSGASSEGVVQQNKLIITVKATFYDYQALEEKNKKIEKTISNFEFYGATQSLADVEVDLIESISDKIVMDIFNQTVTTTEW